MEPMNKLDEQRLIRSVESVIDLVNAGGGPTESLAKIAQAEEYGPHIIRRMAEAFNQSRTLYHLKSASDRAGDFPLADAQTVIDQLYPANPKLPGEVKQAALQVEQARSHGLTSENFISTGLLETRLSAQPLVKKAEAPRETPVDHDLIRRATLAKQAMEAAREHLQDSVLTVGEDLRTAFKSTPFHHLEQACYVKAGSAGPAMADLLWALSKAHKFGQRRATDGEIKSAKLWGSGVGYASVERLVESALAYHRACHSYKQAAAQAPAPRPRQELRVQAEPVNSFAKYAADSSDPLQGGVLQDNPFLSMQTLKNIGRGLGTLDSGPAYNTALAKAVDQFQDPDHRDQTTRIRTQSMLNDFLANDEVIKGYEPQEVLDSFNEIAQLSPEVVDQPAVMRGLLRRSLAQGHIEPFEASQVVSTGKSLADANSPDTRRLQAAATSFKSLNPDLPTGPVDNPIARGLSNFGATYGARTPYEQKRLDDKTKAKADAAKAKAAAKKAKPEVEKPMVEAKPEVEKPVGRSPRWMSSL